MVIINMLIHTFIVFFLTHTFIVFVSTNTYIGEPLPFNLSSFHFLPYSCIFKEKVNGKLVWGSMANTNGESEMGK
jgi:hypothetical protein